MTRIAVVGGGIAGIGAAWLLRDAADVTLFEADETLGGHVRTIVDGSQPVDTGFIVLNDRNYPYFRAFLDELGIATQPSDMSFGVSIGQAAIEWAGDSWRKLFAQPRLAADPAHWRMIRDILRFNKQAKRFLEKNWFPEATLGGFLDAHGYGQAFRARYLLPMAAAIWSMPTADTLGFPLAPFLRFFDNHGLLDLKDRPQWRTVVGGSHAYVKAAWAMLGDRVSVANPVARVRREADGITLITERGITQRFDHVIFACHADTAHRLLIDADDDESGVLGAFRFQPNRAILHSDPRLMPRRRAVWSSWNYLADRAEVSGQRVAVTYWMNRLQSIPEARSYFVTLNPLFEPVPESVIAEVAYDHPIFDRAAVEAQGRLDEIQGRGNIWYCGAWSGYGFHEDGLVSATRVAAKLGVTAPWAA
ncbi:NAD(P)/FAD-dependent oxidoreductase [Salinisphaera sp. Q1T1-3]|uniref:NAD(P)/FAD-dependent oxidoreductase n=1 Tax=Salinisphaera sp. Q1T1-3 TaxID=2321229 RepID=UPI000E7071F0|nr:FAD-dependent oxidoreductase [Salinisphaera sp. Q1T1-3]RJS94284.1 FAD-dependent oxidoreductase [Salinisphaera sp. Q1T1-3]